STHSYLWIAAVIAWLLFTVLTLFLLVLWASKSDSRSTRDREIIYSCGVGRFGIGLWLLSTCIGTATVWKIGSTRPLWQSGVTLAFDLLPIFLWGGYAWGRIMSVLLSQSLTKR